MARVNFNITGVSEGQPWSGYLNFTNNLTTLNGTAVNLAPSVATLTGVFLDSPAVNFTTSSGSVLVSAGEYVTWRSSVSAGVKYPTTGWSIDIWSSAFANTSGNQWGSVSGNSYALASDKWSLFYLYDSPTAYAWSRGGIITFTTAA